MRNWETDIAYFILAGFMLAGVFVVAAGGLDLAPAIGFVIR